MPATFRQNAKQGESFDNEDDRATVAQRVIFDLSQRYGGDPARVAVGYFSGPGNVAPPGSATPWIRDGSDAGGTSVSQYVSGVLARMGRGGAQGTQFAGPGVPTDTSTGSARSAAVSQSTYPDESALIQQVIRDTPDPVAQARRLSKLTQALGTLRLATETDREDLKGSLPDLQAALLGGQDGVTIPEDRIRRLLPPAQAARELEQLHVAQQAGLVFRSAQWGTPDQVNAALQDLSSGLGPISTMIRHHGETGVAPTAADEGSDKETPEAYRLRTQILGQFRTMIDRRQAALTEDPAGYVLAEPAVAAARAKLDAAQSNTDKASALQDYLTASRAVQQSLGVPEGQQHILTKAEAQSTAQRLGSVDPSKGDMGAALMGIQQQYGKAWPQVFGDLVTEGKLSPEYQILAAMPDPLARTDFQRALAASTQRGGLAKLREDAPAPAVKDIDAGIDDRIADFRRTAMIPGLSSNIGLIHTVRDSIRTLATYYAIQSGDGSQALERATDAVLGSKYDFSGTMRVPKGMLAAAETGTRNLVDGLKPADLAPLAADTQAREMGPEDFLARNKPYVAGGAKDFSTRLSSADEAKFRDWVTTNKIPFDPNQATPDYDMRGFWKTSQDPKAWSALQTAGNVPPDLQPASTRIDPNDNKPHFPDYWKTPYHETFSNESQWATKDAPHWTGDDKLVDNKGNVVFDDRHPQRAMYPGMTVEQRQQVTLDAAKRGFWVPNEDDSALVLVGRMLNGGMIQMRRADGSRIELPFKSMQTSNAPATVPAAADTARGVVPGL
jgi:hypothetical protein